MSGTASEYLAKLKEKLAAAEARAERYRRMVLDVEQDLIEEEIVEHRPGMAASASSSSHHATPPAVGMQASSERTPTRAEPSRIGSPMGWDRVTPVHATGKTRLDLIEEVLDEAGGVANVQEIIGRLIQDKGDGRGKKKDAFWRVVDSALRRGEKAGRFYKAKRATWGLVSLSQPPLNMSDRYPQPSSHRTDHDRPETEAD